VSDEVGIDEVEPDLLAERLAAIAAGAGDECPTGLAVGVFTVGADIAVGGPDAWSESSSHQSYSVVVMAV